MGSGFSKMKKQAKLFEQQLETARKELKTKSATGTSGNGLVVVTVNGEKEMQSITIKPECVDLSDLEGLQDLIKAACENAYQQLGEEDSSLPMGLSLDSFLG
jgi:DNA-binding YbaB/EbfC family protein